MHKQPDEELVENSYLRQLEISAQTASRPVFPGYGSEIRTQELQQNEKDGTTTHGREDSRETFVCETAINGSPKVTVPEDNLVVSSMIQLSKEQEATRDKEVHHHQRNANPAIWIVQDETPAGRVVNEQE